MRILSSDIAFDSTHRQAERQDRSLELRRIATPAAAPRPDTVSLSERAVATAAAPEAGSACCDGLSPVWSLVKQVLEDILGYAIEVYREQPSDEGRVADAGVVTSATALRPAPPVPSFALRAVETLTESEELSVSARGEVLTADGRSISFELGLRLERSRSQTRVIELESAGSQKQKKDPLVINLPGRELALADGEIEFDLDADGLAERIPNLAGGSGFLALDRNGNGRVDDGSELFGAGSGDGFADLARLDDDGNGWIDEGDAAFEKLGVWQRSAAGEDALTGLEDAGIGAIHTGRVDSAFEYRDADNQALASLRSTGAYLTESGQVGSVQQLDFFV